MGLTKAWDLGEEGKGSLLENWQLGILRDDSSSRCMFRGTCVTLGQWMVPELLTKRDHRYITKLLQDLTSYFCYKAVVT